MRLAVFIAAWGCTLGMSLLYIIVGGIMDVSQQVLERRRRAALSKISIVLFESEDQAESTFEDVADLPNKMLLSLIQTLAVDLDGNARRRLQSFVAASGLQRYILRRAKSRRWRRRVQAAQLNYLVTHPDFDRRSLIVDQHPLVRTRAIESLTEDQAVEHVEDLVAQLGDAALSVRVACQRSLLLAGTQCVPALLEILRPGHPAALAALEVAANIADARLVKAVDSFTRNEDTTARKMACEALGNGLGSNGEPILLRMLDDEDPDVRATAIASLGKIGAQESALRIGSMLGDRSFAVRRAAGLALDQLGPPGHLVLRRHLRDPDRFARDMARQVLDAASARVGLDLVPTLELMNDLLTEEWRTAGKIGSPVDRAASEGDTNRQAGEPFWRQDDAVERRPVVVQRMDRRATDAKPEAGIVPTVEVSPKVQEMIFETLQTAADAAASGVQKGGPLSDFEVVLVAMVAVAAADTDRAANDQAAGRDTLAPTRQAQLPSSAAPALGPGETKGRL